MLDKEKKVAGKSTATVAGAGKSTTPVTSGTTGAPMGSPSNPSDAQLITGAKKTREKKAEQRKKKKEKAKLANALLVEKKFSWWCNPSNPCNPPHSICTNPI